MLKLVFPNTATDTLAHGESTTGQVFPPDRAATGEELAAWLAGRVTMTYLRQRLGIETDREAWVFGQGLKPLHVENWYSVHSLIRNSLRLALLLGRARRNARSIQLIHNEVGIAGLPPPFDGLRILQVSDPHVDVDEAFPQVLAERVRDLDYDLCILTGDYRYKTFGPCEPALASLQRVRAQLKGPVYAVLGNHDSIRMVPAMEAMGIRVLLNEAVSLRRGDALLHLVGVDDPHYYRTDNIEAACRGIDHGAPAILAVHSPEVYRHAAHAGFKLMLCGHTHGGQICLPGRHPILYDAACPRHLVRGNWQYQQMHGYTSVGAGSSVVEVRLNCPPEVTIHRLRCA